MESAIRNCDNFQVTKSDVEKIIDWENTSPKQVEIPFKPARVLLQVQSKILTRITMQKHLCVILKILSHLQDFTGVPAVVDLASMRDAIKNLGSDADKINPLVCYTTFLLNFYSVAIFFWHLHVV